MAFLYQGFNFLYAMTFLEAYRSLEIPSLRDALKCFK